MRFLWFGLFFIFLIIFGVLAAVAVAVRLPFFWVGVVLVKCVLWAFGLYLFGYFNLLVE